MNSTWKVVSEKFTILYIACIEQENNVYDNFTENIRNFFKIDFLINIGKSFSLVSTIFISN